MPVAYLGVLTAVGLPPRRSAVATAEPMTSFAVLVPAHDEAPGIAATLESLLSLDYPRDLFVVHVVADNCTDETADVARACGATVHERVAPHQPGKGPALNWLLDRLSAAGTLPDAVVVIDADTLADAGFLRAIDAAMQSGAQAAQGYYTVRDPFATPATTFRSIALTCRHHLRPLARTRMGASSGLYGNGMAFRSPLLQRHRWSDHLVEDAELQMELLLDDVLVTYVPEAVVRAEMPHELEAAASQNKRWERGRIEIARRYVPTLARRSLRRRRRWAHADAVLDHLVPPVSVLAGLQLAATALAAAAAVGDRRARRWLLIDVAAVATLGLHVVGGLRSVGAPREAYRQLLAVPRAAIWKIRLWGDAALSDDVQWIRTARNAAHTDAGVRSERTVRRRPPAMLFGIPIDDITMSETIEEIERLVRHGRAHGTTHQVVTVNVDFLVNALDDPAVRRILQDADISIADGMPVVWGARRIGTPIRERVAGSDLVPLLVDASRRTGYHVHVFGSTPDVAHAATALFAARYPGARFSIDPGPMIPDVDAVDDATLDSIAAVDADILCVALGNPKQERFIANYRERLGVPVMIGVGGSLDMLVGKRRRAPVWMQKLGLEWVVRAVQEPRRLGKRYLRDAKVFVPAFRSERRARRRHVDGAGLMTHVDDVVSVWMSYTEQTTAEQWARAAAALESGIPLLIDPSAACPATDVAAGQLVGLVRIARRSRATVTCLADPNAMDEVFHAFAIGPPT